MKRIQEQFPYQFSSDRSLGFAIPFGWIPSFYQLCIEIDRLLGDNKQGFSWVQLKEKFGSARYYWEIKGMIKNNPLRTQLGKLILDAENATADQCAVCGNKGFTDSTGGWLLVLCKDHALQRQTGHKLKLYDNIE